MKSIIRPLLAVIFCVYISAALSQGDSPSAQDAQTNRVKLIPLGNDYAPDAGGNIQHNTGGNYLAFVLKANNLVPDQDYQLKASGCVLVSARSDADGNLLINSYVTNPETLKKISDDIKRRFNLWQSSHRLALSEEIFSYSYAPADSAK